MINQTDENFCKNFNIIEQIATIYDFKLDEIFLLFENQQHKNKSSQKYSNEVSKKVGLFIKT